MKYLPLYSFLLLSVLSTACQREDKGVVIQNSFPKGGPYTHPTGVRFQKRICWTRVMNQTQTPIQFTLNFPADSFPMPTSAGSYYKLFLPPDTMTLAKQSLFDYEATGLHSFLDTSLYQSSRLQKTVNPNEEFFFYTALLMGGELNQGFARTGVVLKDKDLFYKVSLGEPLDSTLIPCGHIIVKQ